MLGTAVADSVLADPGTPVAERADTPRIYGQRIRIDSLSVTAPRELAVLRSSARRDVIIVPWDFDAACRRARWTQTVLWVTPGRTSFFGAVLRDRQHWAGDIPTFDIEFARFEPYPQRIEDGPPGTTPADALTAAEMFSMNESLPMAGDSSANAYTRFAEWQRRHPELVKKFPASRVDFVMRDRRGRS
jgi:hypothetical protein